MAAIELSLFDWRDVDARSDLDRFYLVCDHLPDTRLVQYLEVMRGSGRDDYPVAAMWNAVVAGVVFQHPSIEALIRELGRNPALRQACGFAVLPFQKKPLAHLVPDADTGRMTIAYAAPEAAYAAVPGSWNFSRFLANVIELEETLGMVSAMIVTLREQLMGVLPEFGRHLGYDGKAALIILPAVGWTSDSAVHQVQRRRWWTALRLSTLRCCGRGDVAGRSAGILPARRRKAANRRRAWRITHRPQRMATALRALAGKMPALPGSAPRS